MRNVKGRGGTAPFGGTHVQLSEKPLHTQLPLLVRALTDIFHE